MPLKRGYKKRRPYVRRRNYRKRPMRMYKRVGANPVPLRMRTKLKYVDTLTANIAAGGNSYWYYQNSLYDPYVPVGGHQPLYFDQYAAMYGYYRVYGMAYNVEFQTVSTTGHLTACVYPQADNNVAGSVSAAAERKQCKFIGFSNQYRSRLKGYISIHNVWAVSRKEVSIDDEFAAAVTTDPVKKAYLFIQTFNPTAVALDIVLTLKITYYCEFFRPITVSQS